MENNNPNDANENRDNVFIGIEPQLTKNCVNFTAKRIWYEDDLLHAIMFVTNGYPHTIYDIGDISIKISNPQGAIAEGFFSSVQIAEIESNQSVERIFNFDDIKAVNANLKGRLKTQCDCTYW